MKKGWEPTMRDTSKKLILKVCRESFDIAAGSVCSQLSKQTLAVASNVYKLTERAGSVIAETRCFDLFDRV
jgi:hypothetical protein